MDNPQIPQPVVQTADPSLKAIRRNLSVVTTLAVLVTLYFTKDLLMPIVLGFLLALTLSPVTRFFYRLGIPHAVSGSVITTIAAVLIVSSAVFSAGTVNSWMADAPELGQQLKRKLSGITQSIKEVQDATSDVSVLADTDPTNKVQEVVIKQPSLIDSAVSNLTSFATTTIVALVLTTFLLASGDMFYLKLVQSFKSMSGKKRALTAVYDIERKVSRYLLTITLINAGLGVAITAALWLLGLPYYYIFGLAAFLLNFVPYAGALAGIVLVGAYSIVSFDSVTYALSAPAAYLALTTIEGQFVTPTLVGRRLEMNTVAVFLTIVVWGWLWGLPGALLAVPFLVVFKVICENFEGLENFANFLGGADPVADTKPD